eukprot:evm.model.NODE_31561_length_12213_cov_34.665684.2
MLQVTTPDKEISNGRVYVKDGVEASDGEEDDFRRGGGGEEGEEERGHLAEAERALANSEL